MQDQVYDTNWDVMHDDNVDNAGWGVEEDLYTTKLDRSNITAEMERRAEAIAQQIMQGKSAPPRQHQQRYDNSNRQQQMQHNQMANNLQSQEQAIEFLRMRQQQQQQQQHRQHQQHQQQQQRPPQFATAADEKNVYNFIFGQLNMVRSLLQLHGEPSPSQMAKFLSKLTIGVLKLLRFPPPDVRVPVTTLFANTHWNIRANRAVKGSHPPTGSQLQRLLSDLVDFFAKRHGLAKAPAYVSQQRLTNQNQGLHRAQQHRGHHNNVQQRRNNNNSRYNSSSRRGKHYTGGGGGGTNRSAGVRGSHGRDRGSYHR
eukprot:g4048.t1